MSNIFCVITRQIWIRIILIHTVYIHIYDIEHLLAFCVPNHIRIFAPVYRLCTFVFNEAISIHYSLKNIPIPSQDAYLRNLIEKVESVIKRMRCKANFFLKGNKNSNESNRFGLPSTTPHAILEMKPFEDDLFNLIDNIKFRNARNEFQESLANDLKKINSSPNIFVFADKTRNIYETPLYL